MRSRKKSGVALGLDHWRPAALLFGLALSLPVCSPFLLAAQDFQPSTPSDWTVRSPGGRIECRVVLHQVAQTQAVQSQAIEQAPNSDQLTYSVRFNGQEVIAPSPLGLKIAELPKLFAEPLRFAAIQERDADSKWTNSFGKNTTVRDYYRETALTLESAGVPVQVIIRAYDDGIAFRYRLAGAPATRPLTVTGELTGFRFPLDPTVWAATYSSFVHAYEHEYTQVRLGSLYSSQLIGLPFLTELSPRAYIAIAEADLTDWAGMYLRVEKALPHTTAVRADLSPRLDGKGLVVVPAGQILQTPWRVLMIGDKPGSLVESDLILNLNPPSAIKDMSWIKPGKMIWDNWWSGDVKMETATEERYIHFASEMGFPYQLVDWQWYGPFNQPGANITQPAKQLDWPAILSYAHDRNVRLWVWIHSGDVNRALQVGTLDEAFRVYERWGLAGIKIDFMDSDDQEMVQWYTRIVQMAAKHHLMVDFHGAFKPTGLRRTWPNLLTREGVLGNEYNKFSGRDTPEHKLTLPFTRMLVGPMDYTPGGFLNRSPAEWKQATPTEVMGSRAQELALFVVYESALACVADDPDHYHGQPGLDFLKVVPTTWDETRVLAGSIGHNIVIARRNGNDWYVGGMTADEAYRFDLPLSFLGAGTYQAEIYADPGEPNASYEAVQISRKSVTGRDTLPLTMRPAGGVAIHFHAESSSRKHGL